jgi:hypothetical protein
VQTEAKTRHDSVAVAQFTLRLRTSTNMVLRRR